MAKNSLGRLQSLFEEGLDLQAKIAEATHKDFGKLNTTIFQILNRYLNKVTLSLRGTHREQDSDAVLEIGLWKYNKTLTIPVRILESQRPGLAKRIKNKMRNSKSVGLLSQYSGQKAVEIYWGIVEWLKTVDFVVSELDNFYASDDSGHFRAGGWEADRITVYSIGEFRVVKNPNDSSCFNLYAPAVATTGWVLLGGGRSTEDEDRNNVKAAFEGTMQREFIADLSKNPLVRGSMYVQVLDGTDTKMEYWGEFSAPKSLEDMESQFRRELNQHKKNLVAQAHLPSSLAMWFKTTWGEFCFTEYSADPVFIPYMTKKTARPEDVLRALNYRAGIRQKISRFLAVIRSSQQGVKFTTEGGISYRVQSDRLDYGRINIEKLYTSPTNETWRSEESEGKLIEMYFDDTLKKWAKFASDYTPRGIEARRNRAEKALRKILQHAKQTGAKLSDLKELHNRGMRISQIDQTNRCCYTNNGKFWYVLEEKGELAIACIAETSTLGSSIFLEVYPGVSPDTLKSMSDFNFILEWAETLD